MTVDDETLLKRLELLAEARQLARIVPEDGVVRYLLGIGLMAFGLRDAARQELVKAVELMTPGEAFRLGWQAARTLRASGFEQDAELVAAAIDGKAKPC